MEQAYSGKCIFLTGATGFMGKVRLGIGFANDLSRH